MDEDEVDIGEINYDKLKGKIKEFFNTQSKFASALDLDEATISNKLNGKNNFTQKEIIKSCQLLNIDFKKIPEYFFTLKVRENEQIINNN